MLKRFEVSQYRGFKDTIAFDLTAAEYSFNKGIVKDGIVNKALIYGKNNTGKSNLGLALMDLTAHLTDNATNNLLRKIYINAESDNGYASFAYYFQFDEDEVVYKYKKADVNYLIEEELYFNGERVVLYDYFDFKKRFIDKSLQGNLQINFIDNKLSVLKYIYRNTPTNKSSLLHKMMTFVNKMLWYRSLSEGNSFIGYTPKSFSLTDKIYEMNKKDDFEEFLKENDIIYKLEWEELGDKHDLMVVFPNDSRRRFIDIMSTGTSTLLLFYAWSIEAFDDVSFLFVDEFDAFLHFESSKSIVQRLNKNRKFQTILTTHNTYLMQNDLTRPDCCFILTNGVIKNLRNSTDKEIREAHNLEKLYINGAFVE